MYHFKTLKSLNASVPFSLKKKIHKTKAKSRPTSHWLSLQWRLGLPTSMLFSFKYKTGEIYELYSYFLKRESRKERNKEVRKERNVSSQELPAPHHSFSSASLNKQTLVGPNHLNSTALTKLMFRFPESLGFYYSSKSFN